MGRAIFIGTYPSLTHKMLDHEMDVIKEFVGRYR